MGHSCLSDQLHDRKHDSCNCSAIGERFAEISFDKTKYRHSGFTKICNYFLRLPVPVFLVHSLPCNVCISTCSCSDDIPDWDTSDKCALNIFQAKCAGVETYAPPLGVIHTVATFSGVLIGNDIEHAAVSAYL